MLAFSEVDAGGVTYARRAKNTHDEMSTKPDRFVDQIDADAKAREFCEGVVRVWKDKIPGVAIDTREHTCHSFPGHGNLPNGVDGRTYFVFGNSGMRLLAVAVVTRDALNYSLLVTKVCDFEAKNTRIAPCDECVHFRPLPEMASAATQKAWQCCALGHPQDFKAPGATMNEPWGLHRPGCEDRVKLKSAE